MFNRLSTNTINWILVIGVILLLVEIAFFKGGMIFFAAISGLAMYMGWKHFYKLTGKVFFWLGAAGVFLAVLNMLAVRFLIIAGIILFLLDFNKSKKFKAHLQPESPLQTGDAGEKIVQVEPLFENRFFGEERTDDRVYRWRDINIHSLYGDKIIDLGNTILPDDVAVISIRQLIGNIEIYVPYEVEVSIHHSSIFGRASVFGDYNGNLMNKSLHYETEGYSRNMLPRVKIITSLISGDIEVKRI